MTTEAAPPTTVAELDVALVPIESVTQFPGNPRRGDVAAIAKSLAAFGQTRPIIVQRSTNFIVGGNHVWAAAKSLGWDSINVVLLDLDDTTARQVLIADNQVATLGQNDPDALASFLKELQSRGALGDALGFSSEALDKALRGAQTPEADPDETPDLPAPRDIWVKPGMLLELGRHRLIVGDSTDPAVLERLMGGKVAGMVWTDPPYGVAYTGGTEERLTIQNDGHDARELDVLLRGAFTAALEHVTRGRAVYVAAPSGDQHPVFQKVLQDLGVFRQTLVWVKDVFVLGRSDYHYRHEFLHYGWRPGAKHYFVSDRTLDTVLEVARPKASRDHPTAKPVALIEPCILHSSKRGDIVLDLFAGGGSTMAACEPNDRAAYMVELEPQYAQVIADRYALLTGGQAKVLD